jgi:hypothetical protein
MSPSKLIRLSGLAAILGVALSVIAKFIGLTMDTGSVSSSVTTLHTMVEMGLWLFSGILGLAGLIGLYARQSESAGAFGLVGFIAAFIGSSLMLGSFWTRVFVVPWMAVEIPEFLDTHPAGTGILAFGLTASTVVFAAGWLLFGVSAFRARVYPRIPVVLLMIGAPLLVPPVPGLALPFSLALAWLGFVLFTGERAVSRPAVPVT